MITTGTVFGRLTVLAPAPAKHDHAYYLCRCKCGDEVVARGTRLTSGEKTACPICAAAKRVVGRYVSGYQIVGFTRSKNEEPRYIAECLQCRERVTIPKEFAKQGIPTCECQIRRAAAISDGIIDADFFDII
ncbi:MAG: hypothetical protein II038_14600 [Lachnospiraceae bacterium]|nr:hypothetical protein [Lachnospiraceae bacterium]